jgi:hypothetical protein
MCGGPLSRSFGTMHTLNARVIAAQIVEERIESASRARRFGRARRRFARGGRHRAPSLTLRHLRPS